MAQLVRLMLVLVLVVCIFLLSFLMLCVPWGPLPHPRFGLPPTC